MGEARRRRAAGEGVATGLAAPDKLLQQARQLQQAGSLTQALALYWQWLQGQPGHADAHHRAGQILVELGQADLGLDHLRRSTTLAPGNLGYCINLAQAQLRLGDAAGALASLEQALLIDPARADVQLQRAGILEAVGRVEPAAEAFLSAAQADPTHALAHHGAAGQLYRLDRLPQAVASQQRAQALDPQLRADGVMGFARARSPTGPSNALQQASQHCCQAGPAAASPALLQQAVAACELLVIDDFLPDALAVRTQAMGLHFQDQNAFRRANFPGLQTDGGHAPPEITQGIADALGRDLKWGWPGHGAFRISTAGSMARSDIHIDHGDSRVAYAGVLYLSLPQHCQGGTSFWRHRETGWAGAPSAEQAKASRWGSLQAFMQAQAAGGSQAFADLTAGRSDWDLLFEVAMRFNRLIVYRSDFFHSISAVFGSGLADGRLVQLFFFEPLGPGD